MANALGSLNIMPLLKEVAQSFRSQTKVTQKKSRRNGPSCATFQCYFLKKSATGPTEWPQNDSPMIEQAKRPGQTSRSGSNEQISHECNATQRQEECESLRRKRSGFPAFGGCLELFSQTSMDGWIWEKPPLKFPSHSGPWVLLQGHVWTH